MSRRNIRSTPIAVFLVAALWSGTPVRAADGPGTNPLAALGSSIRGLTSRVTPAVVEIIVIGYSSDEDVRGETSNANSRRRSSGSGVIVDSDGYIMTNAHVVEGAISVKVLIARDGGDSGGAEARVVGLDRDADLALLKIDAQGLPTLPFGDSSSLAQGDLVFAVGSPMLLRNSLTMGVVSSPARQVNDNNPILYIQTDASINPGDSGGALVDIDGRLVGLNTFIVSKSGGSEGIGFAIPANEVAGSYRQLREKGGVSRGYIGVLAQDITPALAAGLDLPLRRGVVVADVEPNGPADNAGVRRRDVIVSLDGAAIGSARELNDAVCRLKEDARVALGLRRGGETLALGIVASRRASPPTSLAALISSSDSVIAPLGIVCVELNDESAALLPELRRHYGLVVAAKSPEGIAQFTDLRPGDVIHSINNLPVASLDAFRDKIDSLHAGDAVALQGERDGTLRYVAFVIR